MNDITALALLVSKAKASVFTMKYISQFEASDIDSDDVDLRFEVDGVETGTNVSIVDECGQAAQMITALVEALEKAQTERDEFRNRLKLEREILEDADKRIAELEKASTEPVAWTDEQELRDVERSGCGYLFTVNPITPNADPRRVIKLYSVPPALESRTVTVKLPSLKQTESGERYVWSDGVFNYRSDVIGILRAAGIQVIEGEGQ